MCRDEQKVSPVSDSEITNPYDLSGRSAIVTGAGSGIGRAVALQLAARNAAVLVTDMSTKSAQAVSDEITASGGTAQPMTVDVTDAAAVESMVKTAGDLGPLRVAVNNAGIPGADATLTEYAIDDWRRVIEVNLNSVFYCLRAQIPAMIAAGGGSIVNMASVMATVGFPAHGAYVTAKHGMLGLTRNAALEYAEQGIRVNAVGPGFIGTPLVLDSLPPEVITMLSGKHALNRLGTPQEVAAVVSFLASDAASFVTGAFYSVDGGYTAQ